MNMYTNFRCLQYYNTWSNWSSGPEFSAPFLSNRRWHGKQFVPK